MVEVNWTLDALSDASHAIGDLRLFVKLAGEGLEYASQADEVTRLVARSRNLSEPEPIHPTQSELELASKLEAFASRQKPHFPYLFGLVSFRLWAVLEAGVDDWLRDLLVARHEFLERPALAKLEGPLVPFIAATPLEQAKVLLKGLKGRLEAPLKPGVGRFESILDAFGLGGPVREDVRRSILELAEVRNVVAHKGGLADERFIRQCGWFPATEGQLVVVTPSHFFRYCVAVEWYLMELWRRYVERYPDSEADAPRLIEAVGRSLASLERRLHAL